MILEAILTPIFWIIDGIVLLLPELGKPPIWITDFCKLIGGALNFIPMDVWILFIGSIVFWKFGLIAWSVIEWVYKKIPGVD